MKTFGLIGFPFTHSFQKKYFEEKFEMKILQMLHSKIFQLSILNNWKIFFKQKKILKRFCRNYSA